MPLYKNHIGGDGDPSQRMREGFEFSLGWGGENENIRSKMRYFLCLYFRSEWMGS